MLCRPFRYPAAPMRILILGGDGYLGWPTALRFSARGHEVALVDNFSRRRWHTEHGTASLTPIRALDERIEAWHAISTCVLKSAYPPPADRITHGTLTIASSSAQAAAACARPSAVST